MSDETIVSDSAPEEVSESVETNESVIESDTSAPQDAGQPAEDQIWDPKTLPEELKPLAKQLQADYTRKTQAIAEQRKQFEALQAEQEKWKKYEQFAPVLDEMLTPQQQVQASPELAILERDLRQAGYDDASIEAMKITATRLLDIFEQKSLSEKQQIAEQRQREVQQQQLQEAVALDPRLSSDDEFAQVVAGIARSIEGWDSDIVGTTKKALEVVDRMMNKAKSEGKQELSDIAGQKARQFPAMKSSPQGATSNAQPASIKEAWKQAQAELG